jgi:hypothetical protein
MTKEMIIPLLESIGYFKVEFNGGPDEIGKDILCWKYDEFGDLKLTVAQVKHFKFTSSSSDSQSFQTVYNQLTQCFIEQLPYCDQTKHIPEKALLISTHEIETKTLKSRFASQIWAERVTIIDGFKLASLLKKHKPDLVKKLIGLDKDIYSSLEPTLNNQVLLKSLGHFESKSIKHIYIDIDFSLGKTTTQLFFKSKLNPINKTLKLDKESWGEFVADCHGIKSEFELDFLGLSFEKAEITYEKELADWVKNKEKRKRENKSGLTSNDKEIHESKELPEPKYEITILGNILAEKITQKKLGLKQKLTNITSIA